MVLYYLTPTHSGQRSMYACILNLVDWKFGVMMAILTAISVVIVIAAIVSFVFKREYVYKKKVEDFPTKFSQDKEKVLSFTDLQSILFSVL